MTVIPQMHADPICRPESRKYILVTAILASAMGFIDSSVVSLAVPAIRDTLGATLDQAQWVSNAYLLALAALMLAGGALGDRLGLARVFSAGIALFVLASLACALAPTPQSLIGARFLQGIGAAAMVPGSLSMISRAYPAAERGRAIGIWAATASLTTAAGPILAGAVLTWLGPEMWRAIFAINLPFGALALWLLSRHVSADNRTDGHPIDVRGALLATLGLGSVAYGLTVVDAGMAQAAPPLLAGAASLTLFVMWEARTEAPMLPLTLFKLPGFAATNFATFVLYIGFTSILFFLPMVLIGAWNMPEIMAIIAFLPLTIFIGGLSTWAGRTAGRIGAGPLIGAGSLAAAVAFVWMGWGIAAQNFWWHVLPAMSLMSIGMGLVVSPLSVAVMTAAPDRQSGAASGVNNAIARTSGLVAIAALGGVAAFAYARAGGGESFGIYSQNATHLGATHSAFAAVAYTAAALAMMSAAVAFVAIPKPAMRN